MAIRREIYVTQKRLDICIDMAHETDILPIVLNVVDYEVPEGAIATAYSIGKENQVQKKLCDISENEIAFTPPKGFFDKGENVLQIRVTYDNHDLFSYKMTVRCHENIADDDAQEVESQPTLMTQLLTEVANTKSYVNEALLEVEQPNIESSYNGVATERIEPVLPINKGDTLKDILSTLTQIANNEEYNYVLIDEEQLKETVYPTLGEAIKRMAQRLFNLEALAYRETEFSWAPGSDSNLLRYYRIGPVVIANCTLTTYFNTGSDYTDDSLIIPQGYRPVETSVANLVLFNSYSNIGSAIVKYNKDGKIKFRTSTSTIAEYNHTLAWITADEFPYDDASVG